MPDMRGPTKWRPWLRACAKDPNTRAELPGSLAMLTGQDARTLEAIAACWQLYASCDDQGAAAALTAVRALLPALQPKCRGFARELIAWAMDWNDRAKLWPLVAETIIPSAQRAGDACASCLRPLPPPVEGCCAVCGVPYESRGVLS